MKKKYLLLILIFSLMIQVVGSGVIPTKHVTATSNTNKDLPILNVSPESGKDNIKLDEIVEISLDPRHKNFKKYRTHFEQGKYSVLLNQVEVETVYLENSHKIVLLGVTLDANTSYEVDLKIKAEMQNNKNNSENASYSYSFKTGNEGNYSKRFIDADGNFYEIIGGPLVKEVTLKNETNVAFNQHIDLNEKTPLVSSPVKISLPTQEHNNKENIQVNVKYKKAPYGIVDISLEKDVIEWIPFSTSNDMKTFTFRIEKTSMITPFLMSEESALNENLANAPSVSSLAMVDIDESEYTVEKFFNITENDNGSFRAQLTYLKSNPATFEKKGNNPEYYYNIFKVNGEESEIINREDINSDTLNISENLDTGIYRIELYEDDVVGDDHFWTQEIFIERDPELSENEVATIAKKYAPILIYNRDEEFFPISLEELMGGDNDGDGVSDIYPAFVADFRATKIFDSAAKFPYKYLGKYLSYNGHANYQIEGSNGVGLHELFGSRETSTTYYSYIERGDRKFINYHFFYAFDPKDGTSSNPGNGAHNFDRESITIELDRNNKPETITTSGHLETHPMWLEGQKEQEGLSWTGSRLKMPFSENSQSYPNNQNHPIVAVAKGAHALFPASGTYTVDINLSRFLYGTDLVGLSENLNETDFSQKPINNSNGLNFLLPKTENFSTEDFNNYNLEKIDFTTTSSGKHPYLTFSGDWVDVLGPGDAAFPPFTSKEKDVVGWIDGAASNWNFNSLPEINKEYKRDVEEYLNRYLNQQKEIGTVRGNVNDAITNEPIEGADVNTLNFEGIQLGSSIQTNVEGNYSLKVPVGESYRFVISKTGYIPVEYQDIDILKDEEIFLETVLQIPDQYADLVNGVIKGTILRADNGGRITNSVLKLRENFGNKTGIVLEETTSNSRGEYLFEELKTGYYTIEVVKDGYITNHINVIAVGGREVIKQVTLSPVLAEGEIRIVLEWGPIPTDLDSHLMGPNNSNGDFHVYYGNKSYIDNNQIHAELDLDDTSSYGPETITIHNIKDGLYRYSVEDYSNRGNTLSTYLSNSGAKVKVFSKGGYREFNVPNNNQGTIWNVFNLENGDIKPVNTFN